MAIYSWSEAQQIIDFYEQIRDLITDGWVIRWNGNDFKTIEPITLTKYEAPTLEILLGDIRDRNR